ncbi:uncharacterized protein ARMOST_20948 [Armillaria ostoyae]|uniref:F-box domain-containing protein n=1 Tax=Armillaria ostoyae TaxID=47428 RepID=A0A284S8T0_ARMOS|nr:uncharacterized protein ARMOST_20948 [Armillaria ostoyae]
MRRSNIQAAQVIPEEILNKIMTLVLNQSLKALALVNKSFKDTAFSHQFRHIIASPMCDLGAWVALLDVDTTVTAAVRDITISGDSVGEQMLVSAEHFLTRFPFVRSILLQAYDPDFRRLAQNPLRSVRHLCIHNGMLRDIWEYISVAFPNLGTLSLIDFVASRFKASSTLENEKE